jgi:PAS domain S-box-containing protein
MIKRLLQIFYVEEVMPMILTQAGMLHHVDEGSILRAIFEGTANSTGEQFFAALVKNLAGVLKTYSSWVTEYIEETNKLRTLAFWVDGRLVENFTIDVTGTPCEVVIRSVRLVHFPDNMMQLFPDSPIIRDFNAVSYMGVPLLDTDGRIFGNLAVLDNQPMPEEPKSEALFRIFASRASAELQRIRAEEEIRRREEKYRRIIESTGEGFILLNKNFEITEVNTAFCQLVGTSPENVIGKSPLDFATEEFRHFLTTNRKEILYGLCRDFEGALISSRSEDIPILAHGDTLRNDKGEIIGTMAFITNMSEHKKSLRLASEVQKSLLPQGCQQLQGIEIVGKTKACDEVGGDYYDFLEVCEGRETLLNVVVGDVTGHGVDAALLMTSARAFLRMCVQQRVGISQIVTELNRHLAVDFLSTGRFMTLFYVSIDRAKESLRWVRAGHDPAIIYDPLKDEFEELKGTGLALGVDRDFIFEENGRTGLRSGQVIAIGTDGIWDACNKDKILFGKNRFREILRENAHRSAHEIIEAVYGELSIFTHGLKQTDDITLVVMKVQDLPHIECDWQI